MNEQRAISDIDVSGAVREQYGDLSELQESIDRDGLHIPIVLVGDKLLLGARRLRACQQLGWEQVRVQVVESAEDALKLLAEERADPVGRKAYTYWEAGQIARVIYALDDEPRRQARIKNLATHVRDGRQRPDVEVIRPPVTMEQCIAAAGIGRRSSEIIGKLIVALDDDDEEMRGIAHRIVDEVRAGTLGLLPAIERLRRARDHEPEPGQFKNWDRESELYRKRVNTVLKRARERVTQSELVGNGLAKSAIEDMELLAENLSPTEADEMVKQVQEGIWGLQTFAVLLQQNTQKE